MKADPMVSSAQESDPYMEQVGRGIKITLPIDYYEREQESNYKSFFENEASPVQQEAYKKLVRSSDEFNNAEATYTLAQMHLVQNFGFPHNKTLAFKYMQRFNELTDFQNASAVFELGVMHITGLFGAIPIDVSKGLAFYEQAAKLGDYRARMALAYRYLNGINTPKDLNRSQFLYSLLARELRKHFNDTEWNIFPPYVESYSVRIPDFSGGLLGSGLSVTASSAKRTRSSRPDITSSILTNLQSGKIVLRFVGGQGDFLEDDDDDENKIVDYYYTALDDYQGTYTQKRNLEKAFYLLNSTVHEFRPFLKFMDPLPKYYYARCLELLGHMYLTGEGIERADVDSSEVCLKDAIGIRDALPQAYLDLGIINHYFRNNITEAVKCYTHLRESQSSTGAELFQLDKIYKSGLLPKDGEFASLWIEKESSPNVISIGMLPEKFIEHAAIFYGCNRAVYENAVNYESEVFFKGPGGGSLVALNGFRRFVHSRENLVAPHLREAFVELLLGNTEAALWLYAQAAEQGFETAQTNTAFLLYQPSFLLEDPPQVPQERKLLAATYYKRAYGQHNTDALVVAGNIYYNMGLYVEAAELYRASSTPQGSWNLGYMYEFGLGVKQSFHLASRHYKSSLSQTRKVYLGVKLTLLKLRLKKWLSWLSDKPIVRRLLGASADEENGSLGTSLPGSGTFKWMKKKQERQTHAPEQTTPWSLLSQFFSF